MNRRAFIDDARGEFIIGDLAVPVADADPPGALRLFPPAGPVFRPITFGERFRLVERAAATPDPVESLCAAVARRAMISPGEGELSSLERGICQTLALMLAGAAVEAPPFARAMLLVGGSAGWRYTEIEDAEAARIDHLASRLEPKGEEDDDGWSRVILQPEPEHDPELIRRELAMQLLGRFADSPYDVQEGEIAETFRGSEHSDETIDERAWSNFRSAGPGGGAVPGEVNEDGLPAQSGAYETGMKGNEPRRAGDRQHGLRPELERGAMEEAAGSSARRRARVLGYRLKEWGKGETAAMQGRGERSDGRSGSPSDLPEPRGILSGGGGWEAAPNARHAETAFAGRATTPPAGGDGSSHRTEVARPRMSRDGNGSAVAGRKDAAGSPGGLYSSGDTSVERPAMPASRSMPGETGMQGISSSGSQERSSRFRSAPVAPMQSDWPLAASRMMPGSLGRPEQNVGASIIMELADALAELLHEEADLRGIDR